MRSRFAAFGIKPPRKDTDEEGCWRRFPDSSKLVYARSNFVAMMHSRDEFFRFLWENRDALGINHRAYSEVVSIDTASRISPDGLALHETVCQYTQRVDILVVSRIWWKFPCGFLRALGFGPDQAARSRLIGPTG